VSALELVAALRDRGIMLSAVGGRLEVRPASALTDRDRDALRSHAADLLAVLNPLPVPTSGSEPWNAALASRLMYDADTLVEQLGVSGHHPAVNDAAAKAVRASIARDMETLRLVVAEFAGIVRRVAREQLFASGAGQNTSEPGANALLLSGWSGHLKVDGT
jgi:hypothetical protein